MGVALTVDEYATGKTAAVVEGISLPALLRRALPSRVAERAVAVSRAAELGITISELGDCVPWARRCRELEDRVRSLEAKIAQARLELSDSPGNAKWPDAFGKPIGSPCLRPKGHEGKCR